MSADERALSGDKPSTIAVWTHWRFSIDQSSAIFTGNTTHHRVVMLGGVCLRCRVVCRLVRLCRGSPVISLSNQLSVLSVVHSTRLMAGTWAIYNSMLKQALEKYRGPGTTATFMNFSTKYILDFALNHILIWQGLPQLSCGNPCQIWMWYSISNLCYGDSQKWEK